ncbi:Zn(2)-C6 fungal-specific transcription factor [Phycomyces blakesleeanus NRRL 1555(-)]|uniref:Zn(2)-C6 fungal-specific transcription factor n=1 Tax=Phycomyces blakesleeanus (strain ATCC 8743b / DSM 1359 / FGSC 10004 / NBRC 33097 / NRRL 1555) TaxID=763407 RepID=A0A167R0R1_PHYB8|nr:Zn(2)-C6 fungal-specific transcription factor [Phycomyces blakesleeanus NRRL 1555(-)]OAD80577.1 Zn(2)-C6 fungal-specific transcription factor [Phycomyces blakesleeanus NRRL 1555(-)]|eukprot:XP_018298617.1 Zn(2)-C6 fungal-specific transcription factor [Phycomyces blakesleeanus NRRL 1555(-)]
MSNLQKNPEDIGSLGHPQSPLNDSRTITRMHPSLKRPRAPIACYRCHHKKVRCDGAHPNCTRCLSTGVLCAYPNSRRSRNTQPTNVDPFINNLSHLEARIRRIETDLESQRAIMHSVFSPKNDAECSMGRRFKEALSLDSTNQMNLSQQHNLVAGELNAQMLKTEQEVQESRSILAQLRLRGEQKIARGKRAAAAAVSTTTNSLGRSALASTDQSLQQQSSSSAAAAGTIIGGGATTLSSTSTSTSAGATGSSGPSSKETGRTRSVHSSAANRQKLNKSQQAIEKQKKNAILTGSVSPSYNVTPCNLNNPMDTHYSLHPLHPSSALSPSNGCAYGNNPIITKNEYMDAHQFCVEASNTMVDWSLLQRTSSNDGSVAGTSAQLADIHKQHNGILSPTPSNTYRSPNGSMSANDSNGRTFTMSNSPFIQPLNISFNLAPSSSSSSTTTDSTVSSSVQTSHISQPLGNDSCNMFNLSTFMIDDMLTEESHGKIST